MHASFLPAVALLLLLPESASACSCSQPKPYAERRPDYASVFHGKTIAAEWDEARQLRWIRFEVIEDYSLAPSDADTLTVWTMRDEAGCGVDYPVGTEALVFADTGRYPENKPAGALMSSYCDGNASGIRLAPALAEMEGTLGVLPRRGVPAVRRARAAMVGSQVIFDGKARADGVLCGPSGGK